MTTTAWSRLDAGLLAERLRQEEDGEDAGDGEARPAGRYRGRHRRPGGTTPSGWPAITR